MLKRSLIMFLCLLGAASSLSAQPWSGIIDPSRAIDWSQAGVPGGIPPQSSRTQCGPTIAATTDATVINNAINHSSAGYTGCGANTFVKLGPGIFNLTAGINLVINNTTLIGSGPDQTILRFTNYVGGGCNFPGPMGLGDCNNNPNYLGNTDTVFNGTSWTTPWTAGYTQGSTHLTVGDTSLMAPGRVVILDQQDQGSNSTVDDGGVVNSDLNPTFAYQEVGGWADIRSAEQAGCPSTQPICHPRTQHQFVRVVSVDSPTQVTITPAVYLNWQTALNPAVAAWGRTDNSTTFGVGFEDFTLENQIPAGHSLYSISIGNCFGCWVKNIRTLFGDQAHVGLIQAVHSEVRDSYFYGFQQANQQSYGIANYGDSDSLFINNIFEHTTAPMLQMCEGCVAAYNYTFGNFFSDGSTGGSGCSTTNGSGLCNWAGLWPAHAAGGGMYLMEGNQTNEVKIDFNHGADSLHTMFRNALSGNDDQGGKTHYQEAFYISATSRANNIIGNVLGDPSLSMLYQVANPTGVTPDKNQPAIYDLGFGDGGAAPASDPIVISSLFRWGNYDTATGTTRFLASEVPTTGIPRINGNPVPASQTLPNSFFLSAQPPFWTTPFGTPPWPAIGPDVVNGTGTSGGGGMNPGGHVNDIPAKLCFNNIANDTTNYPGTVPPIKVFNDVNCYNTSPVLCTGPAKLAFTSQPPSNVTMGATFGVTVSVEDNSGVICSTDSSTSITVSKGSSATWGTLSSASNPTLTKTDSAGRSSWTDLSITGPPNSGTGTIHAAAAGLTPADSNPITVTNCPQAQAVGKYTLCGHNWNESGSPTSVTTSYSPIAGNGIIAYATWCFESTCSTSTAGITATIGDNINANEVTAGHCFLSPHSPFVADATGGGSPPDFQQHWVWYCPSIPAGVTSFTVTPSASMANLQLDISEWLAGSLSSSCSPITGCMENVDNISVVGNTTGGTSSTITTCTNPPSCTNGATLNSDDLIFATTSSSCAVGCTTASAGSGYTGITVAPSLNTGYVSEARQSPGSGIQTATATLAAARVWFGVIVPIRSTGDTTPPVPGNSGAITISAITAASMTLTWTAATDPDDAQATLQYEVCRSLTNNVSSVANCQAATIITSPAFQTAITTINATGLSSNTTYFFNVVVRDAAGNPNIYTAGSAKTLDNTAPVPGNAGAVTLSNFTASSMTLTWSAATDPDDAANTLLYEVCQSTSNNVGTVGTCEAATVIMNFTTNVVTTNATGLTSHVTYYFNVVVRDTAGNKSIYTTTSGNTLDNTAPTPGNSGIISFTNLAQTSLTVNWTKATDIDDAQASIQYEVCRSTMNNISTVPTCESATIIMAFTTDDASVNDGGLLNATQYFYNVVVKDPAGNKNIYTTGNVTTLPGADMTPPVAGCCILYFSNVTAVSMKVSWTLANDPDDAQSVLQYEVCRSLLNNIATVLNCESNGVIVQPFTTNISTIQAAGLTPNTLYFWNVVAKDVANNRAPYTPASQKTLPQSTRGPRLRRGGRDDN